MKKQYISPIIEFHSATLNSFMQDFFSDNEPDAKERDKDFKEEFEAENLEENGLNIQKSLW